MLRATMGSSSKPKDPPPPPPPAPVPKTADAFDAYDSEVRKRKRGSSYDQSFLAGGAMGGTADKASGATSFLGGG